MGAVSGRGGGGSTSPWARPGNPRPRRCRAGPRSQAVGPVYSFTRPALGPLPPPLCSGMMPSPPGPPRHGVGDSDSDSADIQNIRAVNRYLLMAY